MPRPLALALLLISLGCTKTAPEAKISGLIDGAITAANEQRPGPIIDLLAEPFTGPRGMDRREAARVIYGQLLRMGKAKPGWVRVVSTDRSIEVSPSGDQAEVVIDVLMARGAAVRSPSDLLPTNADALRFTLRWALVDGDWVVRQAEFRRI